MKKIGLICLAVVLALGGLGVGYAMWSDTVAVTGPVTTGTVLIGFQELITSEVPPEAGGKDVGSVNATLETPVGIHYSEFYQEWMPIYDEILVTISNGYPCYYAHVVFTVANGGTIPVHIKSFTLSDPTGELDFMWITAPPATPATGFFWKDFDGDEVYDAGEKIIQVQLVNLVSHQLEPCDESKAELDFHIEQPAEQSHTYTIAATIVGEQWAK